MEFFNEEARIIVEFLESGGFLKIKPQLSDKFNFNRLWLKINATENEHIYGCGEQYSELDLRGKCVPIWVEEQGICRGDPRILTFLLNLFSGVGGSWHTTYYSQPSFISSNKYFCHLDTSYYSELSFNAKYFHELHVWEIPQTITIGKYQNFNETLNAFTSLIGRQPPLPDWVFNGIILAIQGEGGLDAVRQRLKTALDSGIPVSAIWSQDWQGINVTKFGTQLFWDWKWDGKGRPIRFPNFPEFVKEIGEKGIRYMGYINPFLNINGGLYETASKNGYCVKDKSGDDYLVSPTTFPVAIIDLSNPEAYYWIKNVIKENMIGEAGLSGWMCDFGEYLPTDAVLHSGISAIEFHNEYPVIWQKVNYDAVKESKRLHDIIYFARSGYSGSPNYSPLIWAGDQLPTWSMDDGLASVIPAALSLGLCGIGYHHSDIGGYTTFKPFFIREKELFMRWAEQAAFTMVMRTHESNQPEINVQFDHDEDILSHLSRMSNIHVKIKPYLIKISEEYQKTGISPIRPLFIHYDNDETCYTLKYQYMLGSDLIVAPVIKRNRRTWKVYLPDDSWIHLWTDKEFPKGWVKVQSELGYPPVFYKKESKFLDLFNSIA
ncbi:MAG: alpha-glucosidase [Candidatus Lokiarchaeota archaeon]|nr:alpha-glucosidase [Candidatus Lokiarchaeota archaeon]